MFLLRRLRPQFVYADIDVKTDHHAGLRLPGCDVSITFPALV